MPFLVTFELAKRTFNAATLVYPCNVSAQNPLEACSIITIGALQVFHNRFMLSGLVKAQRGLVRKGQVTNIACLLDLLVNCHEVAFYCSFAIPQIS